jgi:hypothetical protein
MNKETIKFFIKPYRQHDLFIQEVKDVNSINFGSKIHMEIRNGQYIDSWECNSRYCRIKECMIQRLYEEIENNKKKFKY